MGQEASQKGRGGLRRRGGRGVEGLARGGQHETRGRAETVQGTCSDVPSRKLGEEPAGSWERSRTLREAESWQAPWSGAPRPGWREGARRHARRGGLPRGSFLRVPGIQPRVIRLVFQTAADTRPRPRRAEGRSCAWTRRDGYSSARGPRSAPTARSTWAPTPDATRLLGFSLCSSSAFLTKKTHKKLNL